MPKRDGQRVARMHNIFTGKIQLKQRVSMRMTLRCSLNWVESAKNLPDSDLKCEQLSF
jgi:hypothetical protein